MWGRWWLAALAGVAFLCGLARADDVASVAPKAADGALFEASSRLRFGWTEIALRSDKPKAWDETISPEVRASLRVLAGLFEAKVEIGAMADSFDTFDSSDTNSFRADVQAGINSGTWSYLVEWKLREVFQPGYDDFLADLETYDLKLKKRFSASLFKDLPPGLFQVSASAGYVAAIPHFFARNFADIEVEMVQRFADGFTFTVAPKVEVSDFVDFPGDRKDAVVSLRLIPAYNFGGGVSVSVEGQATFAFSTLATKTGETWSMTPILRLQKAF